MAWTPYHITCSLAKLRSSFGTEPTSFAPLTPWSPTESWEDPSPQRVVNELLRAHLPQPSSWQIWCLNLQTTFTCWYRGLLRWKPLEQTKNSSRTTLPLVLSNYLHNSYLPWKLIKKKIISIALFIQLLTSTHGLTSLFLIPKSHFLANKSTFGALHQGLLPKCLEVLEELKLVTADRYF